MKIIDKGKKSKAVPIKLVVHGEEIYMRNLTMGQVDELSSKAREFEIPSEKDTEKVAETGYDLIDLIFNDVLVDKDGELYDEIKNGMTAKEICKDLPMSFVRDIISAVMDSIAGVEQGK